MERGETARKNAGWKDEGMKGERQEREAVLMESMQFDNMLL